jgi:hypothetical protein
MRLIEAFPLVVFPIFKSFLCVSFRNEEASIKSYDLIIELKMLTSISIRLRLYIKICKIWLKLNCPISANLTSQAQGCKLSDEKPMKSRN